MQLQQLQISFVGMEFTLLNAMDFIPSAHAIAALLLACAMFYGFASGRVRVKIISLLTIGTIALGLYFFPLPNQLPKDALDLAFGGFGHHALITICALGRGLVVTGALNPAARTLTRLWQYNQSAGFLITLFRSPEFVDCTSPFE